MRLRSLVGGITYRCSTMQYSREVVATMCRDSNGERDLERIRSPGVVAAPSVREEDYECGTKLNSHLLNLLSI